MDAREGRGGETSGRYIDIQLTNSARNAAIPPDRTIRAVMPSQHGTAWPGSVVGDTADTCGRVPVQLAQHSAALLEREACPAFAHL